MKRSGYSDTIEVFLDSEDGVVLSHLVNNSDFAVELPQRDAWNTQIVFLKDLLQPYRNMGSIYFEFAIPRLGKRIDVIVIIGPALFVLEFKVGESDFPLQAIDQVYDYALDLKNFHESSHNCFIAPLLISTAAKYAGTVVSLSHSSDRLFEPILCDKGIVADVISKVLQYSNASQINIQDWERGRYCPTPTIIEAATALYGGHGVEEISRSDASAKNITTTSETVNRIIRSSKSLSHKSICFVTGVPGAGKTLVGLNISTQHLDSKSELYSVFLSGNGPLVAVLREALARDKVRREQSQGRMIKKGVARSEVKALIQNVHHFRDDCLADLSAPIEHVAIFDEAQRAWNTLQTTKFMRQKKGVADFNVSEPEFLISCLDRHNDWATIVCLVGGGQEINTGEAGITEWIDALTQKFPHWRLYISSRLTDSEYGAGQVVKQLRNTKNTQFCDELHLGVSMRSFREENLSLLVKQILDLDEQAAHTLRSMNGNYPIVITRDLQKAKQWLRHKARGTERYGIVVSSQAQRLKPHAIDVRTPVDPVHWFLDGKEDIRSSYYLEDVATEFHVQGLELDWACVTWDADFRYAVNAWEFWSFVGSKWHKIRKPERMAYLKNAYRVLLTRARQGMVIVIPEGDKNDATRHASFYNSTYDYLCQIGFERI